ncbi:zinc finger and BTB domain-containing protein 41-like isoform X34 [Euwallacea similis]|uniref:zinc finger and BTB domain-containing protein 41-like isoform X34 n=1 Tax=Euwallacea similis TaxID=1736056 RepID=UPI00344EB1E3
MDNPGEILRLCRLCLVKDQVNIPIFEEQGDIRQTFLKIRSCLPVKVSRDDKLPKKICGGCSNKLDLFYEFWSSTANSEKTLQSWLGQEEEDDKMQEITKPVEALVKEESEALEDGHAHDQSFDEATKDEAEAPPAKRARRTAAVKAQINISHDSDEDEDVDGAEPITKIEDESDDSDGEEKDPSYTEVPGTSADDQAGPSGLGKDGVEAPSPTQQLLQKFNIKECHILVEDITLNPSLKFRNGRVKIPRFKYKCYVCSTRFFSSVDLDTHRVKYNKQCKYFSKIKIKAVKRKRKMKAVKKEDHQETDDYIKDTSEDGSVFSCKHCWKVFLTKCSLQEHINWHYQNFEIDNGEVKKFYNDYALLMPDVDPFLGPEDVQIVSESSLLNNNNTNVEANLNTSEAQKKSNFKVPLEDSSELNPSDFPVLNLEDVGVNLTASTMEQAVCTKQPPTSLVNREHFRCNTCDNLFLTFDSFGQHIVNEKCAIIGKCCLCRTPFGSNQQLYEHVMRKHSKFRCICNFCFKTFINSENMHRHIMKKHNYFSGLV